LANVLVADFLKSKIHKRRIYRYLLFFLGSCLYHWRLKYGLQFLHHQKSTINGYIFFFIWESEETESFLKWKGKNQMQRSRKARWLLSPPCLLFSSLSNLNFRNLKGNADPVYYEGSTFTTQKIKIIIIQKERAEKERVTMGNFTSPSKSKKDWP